MAPNQLRSDNERWERIARRFGLIIIDSDETDLLVKHRDYPSDRGFLIQRQALEAIVLPAAMFKEASLRIQERHSDLSVTSEARS